MQKWLTLRLTLPRWRWWFGPLVASFVVVTLVIAAVVLLPIFFGPTVGDLLIDLILMYGAGFLGGWTFGRTALLREQRQWFATLAVLHAEVRPAEDEPSH